MAGGNPRAIKAGSAFIDFTLRDSKLRKGLKAVQARMKAVGHSLIRIGAAITAAASAMLSTLGAAAMSFAKFADSIAKTSEKLGIAPDKLQHLQFAAEQTGVTIETLNTALQRMVRRIDEAKLGTGTASAALKELGLDAQRLARLSPDEQFRKIADAMQGLPAASQVRLAMAIFDTEGVALVNTMRGGGEALAAFAAEFERLGLLIDVGDIRAATALGDAWNIFTRQLKHAFALIGAAVAREMTQLLVWMQDVLAQVLKWINNNRKLISFITKLTVAIATLGAFLVGLGLTFLVIGSAAGGLASAIALIGSLFAFLVSNAGLVLVIMGSIASAFAFGTEAGQKFQAEMKAAFGELWTFISTTLSAIGNALAAGDLPAAMEVLRAAMLVPWTGLTVAMENIWIDFTGFIKNAWIKASADVFALWIKMQEVWSDTTTGMTTFFDRMIIGWRAGWNTLISLLTEGWLKFIKWFHETIGWLFFDFDASGEFDIKSDLEANQQRKRDKLTELYGSGDEREAERNTANEEKQLLLDIEAGYNRAREANREKSNRERWTQRLEDSNRNLVEAIGNWEEAVEEAEELGGPKPGTPEFYDKIGKGDGGQEATALSQQGISNVRGLQTLMRGDATVALENLAANKRTADGIEAGNQDNGLNP